MEDESKKNLEGSTNVVDNQLYLRIEIYKAMVSEASGYYKSVITISSSFLGGSLLFFDKIAAPPIGYSLLFLSLGWMFLIAAIISIIYVRRQNLEEGRIELKILSKTATKKEENDVKNKHKHNLKLTDCTAKFMAIGLTFIVIFGMINIINKYTYKEKTMGKVEKKVIKPKEDKAISTLEFVGGTTQDSGTTNG